MHLLDEANPGHPVPSNGGFDDTGDRHDAHRAIAVSAIGMAVTGMLELGIALVTGSVGLLSDALHNLSDVSTSVAVFLGLRISKRQRARLIPTATNGPKTLRVLG